LRHPSHAPTPQLPAWPEAAGEDVDQEAAESGASLFARRWRPALTVLPPVLPQKRDAVPGEKPNPVRTHLRDVVIVPEMIGSVIGVYNGKTFNQVEIKV